MIDIVDLKGLRFPDEYLIRFFFKEQLDTSPGSVLELGCGNGNNLMLFNQYGWNVVGIDHNEESINNANYNFKNYGKEGIAYLFVRHDLTNGVRLEENIENKFNVIIMANSLYYIPRKSMLQCLKDIKDLLSLNGKFFIRMRAVNDYRFGRGKEVEKNGYTLDIVETNEKGLLNVFYYEYELIDILRETIGPDMSSLKILRVYYENVENDVLVGNSDIVIWGNIE